MDALICQQEDLFEHLSRAYANYKKTPKERLNQTYVEAKLEHLETLAVNMSQIHIKIVGGTKREEKSELSYFKESFYYKVEDTYMSYKIKLKEDLRVCSSKQIEQPATQSVPMTSCEVKLPQIQLPKFSGGYEEWQTFYDMFVSLIHNNSNLNAVQKLHYLKSSLSGEPENLLKNLSTTEMNYDAAWSQLTRRYNNKRYNSNEIMKRLFAQRNITSESASSIKQLLDTTSACLKSLDNLGIVTSGWDVMVNHLIVSKLDQESRKQWETQVNQSESDELPSWKHLMRFMEMRFRTLEMIDGNKSTYKPTNTNNSKQGPKQKSFHSTVNKERKETSNTCVMCNGQHPLYHCKLFGKQSPEERSEFIQSKRLCFNCLAPTHSVKSCHHSLSCRRCGRRHHTLLHFERSQQESGPTGSPSNEQESSSPPPNQPLGLDPPPEKVVAHFAKRNNESKVLLATAVVKIKSANGYSQTVRALIDQGSEASFLTEATAQSLGLKRVPVNGLVSGVGDGQTRTKNMVTCTLESVHKPFSVPIKAYVLSTLTSFLPSSKTTISNWSDIANLPLADPNFGSPGRIDLILGAEVYSEIILGGLMRHPSRHGPVAQNTTLGWILSGGVLGESSLSNCRVINLHIQVKEDQLLKQFWEIEREPDSIDRKLTKEEIRCEEIYSETTTRDNEGRYVVRLPFKSPSPECFRGQSNKIALRRFQLLEKKLIKNPSLHEQYKAVMENYIKENHMREITDGKQINDPHVVYLPHHAVVREDKETTKIRVVFDASCKGVNNVSLNENLLVGPKLQQDLRHILMRWRCHAICIVADLEKMYLQIRVLEDDTDCQRIFWRSDPNRPIQHYRLLRLTFGTACAPYLAVKSLQQLAKDEKDNYPIAAKITLEDYYIDDLLTGCDSEDKAIEIYEQMSKLMKRGGFNLQKWCSNSKKLLDHITEKSKDEQKSFVLKKNEMIKVLGISWNKKTDNFEYKLTLPAVAESTTKRKVLSDIARLYDPMGWIAPVIIAAKIYIQKLWKSGLNWDEPLTPELLEEWNEFRDDLSNVHDVIIPRWLETRDGDEVELHVFADASQAGYAAAVYMKTTNQNTKVSVNLITAKTKVAPIEKELSIPRLELCAAMLATKLIYEVSQIMHVPKENLFAWSDSTVVLAWLRGEPSRWVTFVSNRVSEILTMLDRDQWGHVDTHQNPADCASRGISISELVGHDLWWHGPEWLHQNNEYRELQNLQNITTTEEKRPIRTLTAIVQPEESFIWSRFSTLRKALRVLSYCRKMRKLRLPIEQRIILPTSVTIKEMNEVLDICIKGTQEFYFKEEIKQLKCQDNIPHKSPLHTLCPILDENGVLRVGGRTHHARVQFDKRHPIILPSKSHLTKLIISDAHIKTLHGGPQIMLNLLRSKFWIIRARELVKRCYRECNICVRYSRQNNNPLMGQLPEARLRPAKPFESSGVDFTGHINIRFSPGRGSKAYKGYICLFVCMTSKAVHLEAVSDMTAQGFIAAFRRFVSRRGHCKNLYSDNGTNFVGADRELRDMFSRAVSQLPDKIGELLASEGTTWHFIPPHAPNFGGLWEAGVRSTKAHLRRVIGDSTLTFEELTTVLTQIEACLNSRPLSHLSDNPEDPMPLTPGHFLIGEPLIVIPDEDYAKGQVSSLQRWKLTQRMVNDFWKKWSDEYLVTLNQRYKWTTPRTEPEIDDIVVLKDHNLPPAKWLLGRIVEKHTGKDDVTRVVSIKTKNGIYKRPCNKLCFLSKC